jgi:hypothetical protein
MIETIIALTIMACPTQGEAINPNAIYVCAEKAVHEEKVLPCTTNKIDPNKFYICADKATTQTKPYKWVKVKTKWIKENK